jgi:CBS domain-containing protein
MLIGELMTKSPITVREDTSVKDALRLLATYQISGLPVVNEQNSMVGIMSEYDLLAKEGRTVGDIMTRSVISVTPDTPVELVSHLLTDHRIRRLPVLREGKLVGIVSRSDIIRMMSLQWHCEICGETLRGEKAPEKCGRCGSNVTFTHTLVTPGM